MRTTTNLPFSRHPAGAEKRGSSTLPYDVRGVPIPRERINPSIFATPFRSRKPSLVNNQAPP